MKPDLFLTRRFDFSGTQRELDCKDTKLFEYATNFLKNYMRFLASRQIVSGAVARAIRRYVGTRHVTSRMALDFLVTFLSRKK